MVQPVVTVFGSRRVQEHDPKYQAAVRTGGLLAQAGFAVCNGAYSGIMEASARGAFQAGGRTIGIVAEDFPGKVNPWIQEKRLVKTWHERLFSLIETGDAYVVFDGGTGTLTELFVAWEMTNKKMVTKPMVVVGEFLGRLIETFRCEKEIIFNDQLKVVKTPEEALLCLQDSFHVD